jgi:hypothetical protein
MNSLPTRSVYFVLAAGLLLAAPFVAAGESLAPMALNSLSRVPPKIVAAQVMDPEGKSIGSVLRVETDPRGKPFGVEIRLNDGRILMVDASALSYDDSANILVAALKPDQPQPKRQNPGG